MCLIWLGIPPCGRAYFLLLRQKKVAKEKATPRSAPGVARSLALLGRPGGLPELACGSDMANRNPPARLRCSAPSTGIRKAEWLNLYHQDDLLRSTGEKAQKKPSLSWSRTPLGPLRGAEQRRGWRKKGEDCLRAKPEFRSPRSSRVAQGTGEAGADAGSPSFCLLFLGEARKSKTPRKGGTPR